MTPWRKLVVLCIAANVAEASLVAGLGHGATAGLAPQASAVAPFGVFADMRWVSVYHNSWASFGAEVVAMLVVRGAMTAYAVHLAWPAGVVHPARRSLALRGFLGTAFAAILLVPSVTLLFGMASVPISWLFFAAVPVALLIALIAHPVVVGGDWWRRPWAWRTIGWVVFTFVVMNAAAGATAASPAAVWPLIAGATGVFNAWAWVGIVHGVVDRRPARLIVPVAPVSLVVLVAVVVGGTALGFAGARGQDQLRAPARGGRPAQQGPPLLVMSGYGSHWDGRERHPIPGAFAEVVFSYRGLDTQGNPLPYTSADTVKSLPVLDRMFLHQVAVLATKTSHRIAVVAESEGALVAKTALLAGPRSAVSRLVLASPLAAPGQVSYPPPGHSGWGVAGAAGMRLLGHIFQSMTSVDLSPDNAFLASLDAAAPSLVAAMACPLPATHQLALLPLADATVTPLNARFSYPAVVVPAFHGGLIGSPSTERIVARVIEGHTVRHDAVVDAAEDVIEAASSAWRVPNLVPSDYPGEPPPSSTCRAVARRLRALGLAGVSGAPAPDGP